MSLLMCVYTWKRMYQNHLWMLQGMDYLTFRSVLYSLVSSGLLRWSYFKVSVCKRAWMFFLPRQTWLCSSVRRRDRSPSFHYKRTRKKRRHRERIVSEIRADTRWNWNVRHEETGELRQKRRLSPTDCSTASLCSPFSYIPTLFPAIVFHVQK